MKCAWAVWIDKNKKVITFKETPNASQIYFESKETGMKIVLSLIFKGYKIG